MPSSVIRRFEYQEAARRLDIEFVTGRRYSYHDVPAQLVRDMRAARSRGQFFNRYIRDHFRFTRTDVSRLRVGTAGWSLPTADREHFPSDGSSLARYAERFPVTEINSSFHRPHRRSTYERWAATVGSDFRFSVKLPRTITHQARLADCEEALAAFIEQIGGLGERLGVLLVQLPPSLALDPKVALSFFSALRAQSRAAIACEPRHLSWFSAEANALLADAGVARVAADPALAPEASVAGGWPELRYIRLHGSPLVYKSSYGEEKLGALAAFLGAEGNEADTWCIFDNTARNAAIPDALLLQRLTSEGP